MGEVVITSREPKYEWRARRISRRQEKDGYEPSDERVLIGENITYKTYKYCDKCGGWNIQTVANKDSYLCTDCGHSWFKSWVGNPMDRTANDVPEWRLKLAPDEIKSELDKSSETRTKIHTAESEKINNSCFRNLVIFFTVSLLGGCICWAIYRLVFFSSF